MQPRTIKNVASLHIYGVKDVLINNDRTLQLAAAFENPVVISHPGGHFTPNSWPNTAIKQFLIEQQGRGINTQIDQSQFRSLNTFEEKLEATISYHQKRKLVPVVPIGLSKPFADQSITQLIGNIDDYPFDDVMLLIWCERTTFHSPEPKDTSSLFFQHWLSLYLKKPAAMLPIYLNFIPKYGSWGDIKTLHFIAGQEENDKTLLDQLKSACVKMFGDQLKKDHRIILNQPDESANEQEEQLKLKSEEWISNCAKEAPRLSNNRNNANTSKPLTPHSHRYNSSFQSWQKKLLNICTPSLNLSRKRRNSSMPRKVMPTKFTND